MFSLLGLSFICYKVFEGKNYLKWYVEIPILPNPLHHLSKHKIR